MTNDDGRDQTIRGIVDTYSRYKESGASLRWTGKEPGIQEALRERDRWLVRAAGGALDCVVDLGCGDGNAGRALDAAGARPRRYVGLDLLPDRIATAKMLVPWGDFHVGSADRIPADDGSVDAVLAFTMFSSVPKGLLRNAIAKEISRVLRPAGRVLIYDIRLPSPFNPSVSPITLKVIRALFLGWSGRSTTMTVLPPLARSRFAGGPARYRVLAAVPVLRSHRGTILVKP